MASKTLAAATSSLRTLPPRRVPAPASWAAPKSRVAAASFLLSTLPRHVADIGSDLGGTAAAAAGRVQIYRISLSSPPSSLWFTRRRTMVASTSGVLQLSSSRAGGQLTMWRDSPCTTH